MNNDSRKTGKKNTGDRYRENENNTQINTRTVSDGSVTERKGRIGKAFRAAFPHTLPIMAGFAFLGMSYGIYMSEEGFPVLFPTLMAMCIFAGSVEFVTVSMLLGAFNPLQALIVALMVNSRHLFYGLSMLDKYKNMGWKKFFLIFWMCDESFSINYSVDIPEGVDRGWFMLWVSILNYSYWVIGATIGSVLGSLLVINTAGIEFVMVAMFVVIFMDQWKKEKVHANYMLGLGLTLICRLIFGVDNFMIPAMLSIMFILSVLKVPFEKMMAKSEAADPAKSGKEGKE